MTMISVCVPIYNTAKYLRKCLDSLRSQRLNDIEFILIDDGSIDDSGIICDEYVKTDSRFKVIHQNNGGSASARQAGLNNARGEYVIVCDSDDWVEPYMYEKLYRKAKETNADIIVCGYYAEYGDGRTVPVKTIFKEQNGLVDNDDFLNKGAGSSWVKLIKKSLFDKTGACYKPGINMSEDALIIYKLMKGNPKIHQINEYLYHYRRLPSGESYTNNIKMSHILQMDYTYNWLKNNYSESKFEQIIYSRAVDIAYACLRAKDTDLIYLRNFLQKEIPWKRIFRNEWSLKLVAIMLEKILPFHISKQIVQVVSPLIYR